MNAAPTARRRSGRPQGTSPDAPTIRDVVFSSVTFLFFFLPAVILAYYLAHRPVRNLVLLLASVVFYTWGAESIVVVLAGSVIANYFLGLAIQRASEEREGRRAKVLLGFAVVLNVGLLAWFKYANFGLDTLDAILVSAGEGTLPWTKVVLPVGISFYTFHSLSYMVDIYRGMARHLSSPIDFGLVSRCSASGRRPDRSVPPDTGPADRPDRVIDTVRRGCLPLLPRSGEEGAHRRHRGAARERRVLDTDRGAGTATAVVGIVAYTVQLYFDFSGYSDMALGLGDDVRHPPAGELRTAVQSRSVTEFWRRWHMSLSRGSGTTSTSARREPRVRAQTVRNLMLVIVLIGLWHGAAWTFVVWGLYHGLMLLVERRLGIGRGDGARAGVLSQVRTVVLVVLGWVLFRSPDLQYAIGYYGAILRPDIEMTRAMAVALDPLAILALAAGVGTVLLPPDWVTGTRLERPRPPRVWVLRLATVGVAFPLAIAFLVAGDFSPFLYFQF